MEHTPSTQSSQAFLSFANCYNSLHVLLCYSPLSLDILFSMFLVFPLFLLLCRFQWKDFIVILLTGFLNVCPANVRIISTPPDSMKCVYSPQWQALHYWCSHSMCVSWVYNTDVRINLSTGNPMAVSVSYMASSNTDGCWTFDHSNTRQGDSNNLSQWSSQKVLP